MPSGRRAFGAQRRMTPAQKARNIAESIQQRRIEGRGWTWSEYGIHENIPMIQAVLERLQKEGKHVIL